MKRHERIAANDGLQERLGLPIVPRCALLLVDRSAGPSKIPAYSLRLGFAQNPIGEFSPRRGELQP
jgi:hypothetical protein